MGSAAPSNRRRLVAAVATLFGVTAVALAVGLPFADPGPDGGPELGSESLSPNQSISALDADGWAEVTVTLDPGPIVPTLDWPESHADGHGSEGGEAADGAVVLLEPGAPSIGASSAVPAGAAMVMLDGAFPPHLAVRTGVAGNWSPWYEVVSSSGEGPDAVGSGNRDAEGGDGDGTIAVGPLWIAGATDIELVAISAAADAVDAPDSADVDESSDAEGSSADADLAVRADLMGGTGEITLTFVATDEREADLNPAGAAVAEPTSTGGPSIIGRDVWANADWDYENGSCDEGPSEAARVQAVVVHHTVTTNAYSEADVDDLLRAIRYTHVELNGWCDIGYNFVVDRFGRIWEARTGSIDRAIIGGHARGFNTSTVGIALLGQHHPGASPASAAPSAAASAAVEELAHWKLESYGVDPAGKTWLRNRSSSGVQRLASKTWHHVPTVLGHRDLGFTSCPGGHGYDVTRSLPTLLAARRDSTLPYSSTRWQAHSHGPGFVVADANGGIDAAGAATPWSQGPTGVNGNSVIAVGGNLAGGYLLVDDGRLVGFGASPAVADRPAGAAAPVDLVVRADGTSGWVLDENGRLNGFGGSPDLVADVTTAQPVAASLDDSGRGWILSQAGGMSPVGGIGSVSPATAPANGSVVVDLTHRSDGSGWILDDQGRLHGFGGAASARVEPVAAVRAVAAAANGTGGWVLDAEGQLWPFDGARLVFPVSTDATAGDAVDLDRMGVVYSPEFIAGDDARYIAELYQLFLGREPSLAETDLAAADLELGVDRIDLVSPLVRSEHWVGGALDEMYQNVLGRPPDDEGRSYWLGEISDGLELEALGTYFYGSAEYATRAGSTEAYVTALYWALLRRPPDDDGLAYWADLLETGQATEPDVANGFYASIESRRDRADALIRTIYGSAPDDNEREKWAERLAEVGDGTVAAELAASSSFYSLVVDGPEP